MSIEVHVRVRPEVSSCVWSSAETVLYNTSNPNTRYVYNRVHPSNSSNHTIFKGLEAIVHAAFDGKNVTIMAYGQTGSGKTHSMIGVPEDVGIVPRAARLLLELKHHHPGTSIEAYYTEVYNESVKDLLEPQRGELVLHDAPDGGVVYDKKTVTIESYDDFLRIQAMAEANRKYGVTNLNDHSSRSHIILAFEIHRSNRGSRSVLNLVDLAGAECAARANTEGLSLREGGFINKSLLSLGNVVDAIVEKRPYVPYRDAKLTRILRNCLGGSGITFILCCINPSRENMDQTVAALRFTQRAMKIKNDPVVLMTMPPLFTHQYSDGARGLVEGLQDACDGEYQRGLRDTYLFCSSTVSSVIGSFHGEVAGSLEALTNLQRLLLAHDHAAAVERIGRFYNQLGELSRQRSNNQELAEDEHRRQREVLNEVENRRAKKARLEEELHERVATADTDLANWEYRLHEAHHKSIKEMDVLLLTERARRARIVYEWSVCVERIASRCVPVQKRLLLQREDDDGGAAALELLDADGTAEARARLHGALLVARQELADLELAHSLVRDDIERAKNGYPVNLDDAPCVGTAGAKVVPASVSASASSSPRDVAVRARSARREAQLEAMRQWRHKMPSMDRDDEAENLGPHTRYTSEVSNALSVLNDLRSRLLPKGQRKRRARASPSIEPPELDPQSLYAEPSSATNSPFCSTSNRRSKSRSLRNRANVNVRQTSYDEDEDVTLLELYKMQQLRAGSSSSPTTGKENTRGRRQYSRSASQAKCLAAGDDALPSDTSPHVSTSTHRHALAAPHHPVERTLWRRNASSKSPSV